MERGGTKWHGQFHGNSYRKVVADSSRTSKNGQFGIPITFVWSVLASATFLCTRSGGATAAPVGPCTACMLKLGGGQTDREGVARIGRSLGVNMGGEGWVRETEERAGGLAFPSPFSPMGERGQMEKGKEEGREQERLASGGGTDMPSSLLGYSAFFPL